MAIVNAENMSASAVMGMVQEALAAHRAALSRLNELYTWTSGIAAGDLQTLPGTMPLADANALLAAVADGHAEYLLHTTGLPPAAYPQPSAAYVYGQSQTGVIGPLA